MTSNIATMTKRFDFEPAVTWKRLRRNYRGELIERSHPTYGGRHAGCGMARLTAEAHEAWPAL